LRDGDGPVAEFAAIGAPTGPRNTRERPGMSAFVLEDGVLYHAIMDLRTMSVVAAAITVERLAPAGDRRAQAIAVVVIRAGLFLIARAGLG
jgi:hypothetical protein